MNGSQSEQLVARGREKLLQFRKSRSENPSINTSLSPRQLSNVNSPSVSKRAHEHVSHFSPPHTPYSLQKEHTSATASHSHSLSTSTTSHFEDSFSKPSNGSFSSNYGAPMNGLSHESSSSGQRTLGQSLAEGLPRTMHSKPPDLSSTSMASSSPGPAPGDLDIMAELQSRLNESQREHSATKEKLAEAERQVQMRDSNIDRLTETLERLNGEIDSGRMERERLQKNCEELRAKLSSQSEVLAEARSDNSALAAEFQQYMRDHSEAENSSTVMNSSVFASQVQEQANVVDRALRNALAYSSHTTPQMIELQRQVDRLREIVDPVGMVLGASLGSLLGGDSGSVASGALDTSIASTMSPPPAVSQPPSHLSVPSISSGLHPLPRYQNGLLSNTMSSCSSISSMDVEKERKLQEEIARLRKELDTQISSVQTMQKRVGEINDEKKMLTSSLQQSLSDITSNFAAQAEELRDARNALSGEKKRTDQLNEKIVSVTNRLKERSLESKYLEERLQTFDADDDNPDLNLEKKKVQCLLEDKIFLAKQFEASQGEIGRLSDEMNKMRDELATLARKREERKNKKKKRVDPFNTAHVKKQNQTSNGSLWSFGRTPSTPGGPVIV